MRRLLAANFTRLKRDKPFWIGMAFMMVCGILMPVMRYITMQHSIGYTTNLDDGFFSYALFIGIVSSVFCSLFVGTEYSDGTIRNKIVVGHMRADLYLSNLIVCMAAGFLLCIVYLISVLAVGIPLLGFFKNNIATIILFIGCVFIMTFAFTAIFVLIAMLNQNKAVVCVICILGAFIFLTAGSYINARLSEPEMYDSYSYVNGTGEIVKEDPEPNPNYLRGTERKIYEFLYDFLPGGQAVQFSAMEAAHLLPMILYSLGIIVFSTGFGVFFFQRKDLK